MPLHHATSISFEKKGILIRGPSGSGKSDLAFRLINKGAALVSDDYTEITPEQNKLIMSPPKNIEGKMELRGVGLIKTTHLKSCPLHMIIDLVQSDQVPRLPENPTLELEGYTLPAYKLCAFETSTPEKILFLIKSIE